MAAETIDITSSVLRRTKPLDYRSLEGVESVATFDFGGAKFKIIGHRDMPKGEIRLICHGRHTGTIRL